MILPHGAYERLLDAEIEASLEQHPELRAVFTKIDLEEQPARYASFLSQVIVRALRQQPDPDARLVLVNRLITEVAHGIGDDHPLQRLLVSKDRPLLVEVTPPHYAQAGLVRPESSFCESSLFTGSPSDPPLAHELAAELASADSADVLVSFIKWPGLRLLAESLGEMVRRGGFLRVISTSYMGASDAEAIEWLARLPNTQVRISYDTERTRLHAKAYHFQRKTGFSTAYIGSANMSHAAMTSGVEWTVKVTTQDQPHIIEKFTAEFETYWNSREFVRFDPEHPEVLREAIQRARHQPTGALTFFDLKPYDFQERILDALHTERAVHQRFRNLVVAATGTGKTVVAAFDFRRFFEKSNRSAKLLFIAHRREILEQAVGTFRGVLRDSSFGELLVGFHEACRYDHLFCSIEMLQSRRVWERVGANFYDFIVVDEVHHGPASSYRVVFEKFAPSVLLGLTATPERMDGESVATDFCGRFAAEIRLPEALDQKLLCPFHYFGVADPVSLDDERFWRNGKYDVAALEAVFTGAHVVAMQRVDAVVAALGKFEPDLSRVKGIGFCVSVPHAEFMAEQFTCRGIPSAALVGITGDQERDQLRKSLRSGEHRFLFTVDVFNEGVDLPELNTVLFLRPTESLTVFLQQLGRGLRHAPEKDCLTVLDFVGRAHRRYRFDRIFKALLPKTRFNIEREVEASFPHLPAGCSIQLDRVSRQNVLENIRTNLRNLKDQVIDRLESFSADSCNRPLTFGNFVRYHDYEAAQVLKNATWSQWKARARLGQEPADPDLELMQGGLVRAAQITGPLHLQRLQRVICGLQADNIAGAITDAGDQGVLIHYQLWGKTGAALGFHSIEDSFRKAACNHTIMEDWKEVLQWAGEETTAGVSAVDLPFHSPLELHANYSGVEIQAALGAASLESAGQTGVGVIHFRKISAYALLITFQKAEQDFSPSTMYADYPISRTLLHWESQSNTSQSCLTGQNLIEHESRGYSILVFARDVKARGGLTVPYTFLGTGRRISFDGERPIAMTWILSHPMPMEMFEENRRGG